METTSVFPDKKPRLSSKAKERLAIAALVTTCIGGPVGALTGYIVHTVRHDQHDRVYTRQLAGEIAAAAAKDGFPVEKNFCEAQECAHPYDVKYANGSLVQFIIRLTDPKTADKGALATVCDQVVIGRPTYNSAGDITDMSDYQVVHGGVNMGGELGTFTTQNYNQYYAQIVKYGMPSQYYDIVSGYGEAQVPTCHTPQP